MTGLLRNTTHDEEIPVIWLYPKSWNGQAVVWLDDSGRASIQGAEARRLVAAECTVLGADLLFQGGEPLAQTPVVPNAREFAGYTHGYNPTVFASRVHDVFSLVGRDRAHRARGPGLVRGRGGSCGSGHGRFPLRQAPGLPSSPVPARCGQVPRRARSGRPQRPAPLVVGGRGSGPGDVRCGVARAHPRGRNRRGGSGGGGGVVDGGREMTVLPT